MKRTDFTVRRRHGFTLVEVLAAAIIVGFLVGGSAVMLTIGEGVEESTRMYSNIQTNIRDAMHPMTRALRHGYSVNATGTLGSLVGKTSSSSQIECTVPSTPSSSNIEMLFYVSGGKLYYERSTDTSATAMLTGVNSMSVVYYTTTNGTTAVASAPNKATEIQVTLSVTQGPITTTAQSYVWMRN